MTEARPERPVYCGNYEYEMPEKEIRRMFDEYGDVERIDMKSGFCFIYMVNERDAERAIRKLDGREVGYKRRPLRVQWAKTKEADRRRDARPSTTLFVVNFDLARTRERDIERHFEPYGRIKRVDIKKSYAFVQFETLEDAEYAMRKANGSQLDGRTIAVRYTCREEQPVEYVQNENPNAARERGYDDRGYDDRGRGRSMSPRRGSPPRGRSPRGRSPSRSASPRSRSRSPRR